MEISQICEEIHIPSGAVVFHKGQRGEFLYLVEAGCVGIENGESRPGHSAALSQAPTLIGATALAVPEGTQTSSVKAVSDLRVITFPIIPFLPILRRFPALKKKLLQATA